MRSIEDQAQIIRDAGYRLTRAREAVLEVLAQAEGSLDAAAIHRRGRRIHAALGRVSVYRTLDLLEQLSLIRQLHGEDGCHTYARADRPQGHYLVCQRCGQVTEFPCVGLEEAWHGRLRPAPVGLWLRPARIGRRPGRTPPVEEVAVPCRAQR